MDLSALSDADLMALKGGDLSKVSDHGLQHIRRQHIAAQINNDPISQGARDTTSGMSFTDKFNAGAGKAFADLGRGVGQKLGLVSNQQVAESRRLDAPLMATGAAKAGNLGANVAMLAPSALIPGAGTVAGATAIGGVVGALQPSTTTGEAFGNTALGMAGGAGGQWIANKAAGTVATQEAANALKTAQGAQKTAAAERANKLGYVIPPEDLGGGVATKVLSGIGGKIKTAQVFSERNQTLTNALTKKALGIAEDAPLDQAVLKTVRSAAGQGYEVVKNTGSITADSAYTTALDNIAKQYTTAAQAFPGAVKSEIPDLVAALKQPTFSADGAVEMTKVLRSKADQAFANRDTGTGKAMKDAADALEDMMGRHLQARGMPDALATFQKARETIAKSYTAGRALNATTGDVSAPVLANMLAKGKPLSGELLDIAKASQAFPKATQALKEAPKTFSPLDVAFALSKAAGGHGLNLLTLGARPAARATLLSGPMQRNALQAAGEPAQANALARLLARDDLALPMGVATGNALSPYLSQQ